MTNCGSHVVVLGLVCRHKFGTPICVALHCQLSKRWIDSRQDGAHICVAGRPTVHISLQTLALAYPIALEERVAPGKEELGKHACLCLRELIVLFTLALSPGPLSDIGFEAALATALAPTQLDACRRSQMHLCRSAIRRLGRDRVQYDHLAPHLWPMSSGEQRLLLFVAYEQATH